ncbi:nudC domain-containing protein 3 [Spodoptera frugiperda]|uniref:NudC domain-containing protein 3 n=1 Tax=Spodoptera frugiperda TaxID=7108 RepID=A0A9R0EH30_SPOFR|nr:nudC domain-containing protein 3 [Spodoptera frugiperda]
MSDTYDVTKYDDVLTSILVNEKSILGFLSAIFGFLARRTDFYYVPQGAYENMGFPPGVAEELVIKVLRTCDPKTWKGTNGAQKQLDLTNEIMCSTVAQEVEVVAENEEASEDEAATQTDQKSDETSQQSVDTSKKSEQILVKPVDNAKKPPESPDPVSSTSRAIPEGYKPPEIPVQKDSDTYNGAERENYLWSQNIMELDVIVKLPPDIKSSKDLKVAINAGDISVATRNGDVIIKDTLPYKIKAMDSFWSMTGGKLLMHLEKVQERWWNRLLNSEPPIDLDKIDCSRPLDDLPEDHVAKVRELQWNQERKMKGLPTSDEIRNMDVLKKAWNAPGSPFIGQEFDPSVLSNSSHTIGSFGH